MQRLIVENNELDLGFEKQIPLTLQANDLGNISTRNSSYSNSITLPPTSKNKSIFDYLGVKGNLSTKPYEKLRCRYSINNITLIENGYLQILEVSEKGYRVNIYDGVIDLSERIKGLTLRDLDFSDLNHFLDTTTLINSFSNTSGYIYGIADFGKPVSSTLKVENQAPSIYLHTVWDKIFNEAGINYVGDFFTTNQDFLTEVISPQNGITIENIGLTETDLGNSSTNQISYYENNTSYLTYEEQHIITDTNLDTSKVVIENENIKSLIDGKLRLNFTTTYNKYETFLNVRVYLNNSSVGFISFDNSSGTVNKSILINVNQDDIISLKVFASSEFQEQQNTNQGDTIDSFNQYQISVSTSSTINIEEVSGGQLIDFNLLVPNLKQSDFIKDVMQRYGLVFKISKQTNNVYFFDQIENRLNDKANAVDYSKNFISKNNEDFKLNYGRENIAKYKYPKELVENLFDGILTVDNENLKPDGNLFTSSYEIPIRRANLYKGQTLYRIPIWEQDKDDNTVYSNIETPVKLLRIQRVSGTSFSFKYFDEANSTIVDENIPILSLDKIEMQYFLNVYYKSFQNLLNKYKSVECDFYFNTIELSNIDLFNLVFLKQTGRYYYPQNFKLGNKKTTSSELLEITEFANNLPPTRLGTYDVSINFEGSRTITLENLTTNANPSYFDPEFDEPLKVKILSGFNNPELDIFSNGIKITQETEINANSFDLVLTDTGTNTNAHIAIITFDIADTGSGQYSGLIGTLNANVSALNNFAPNADAGADRTVLINEQFQNDVNTILFGSGSSDNTGEIIKYEWTILNSPSGSNAYITDSNQSTPNANFITPFSYSNLGTYNIQLKVTDSFGLTDTDTVVYTVELDDNGGFEFE